MTRKVCIVGISGKLGQYMLKHALARGYQVTGVCRPESIGKLGAYRQNVTLFPGRTDDAAVVARAVQGCDAVLSVMAPWGITDYASGTARAVLDAAPKEARLIFSCGWHISIDRKDRYSIGLRLIVSVFGRMARWVRFADLDDQVRAFDLIFASQRKWTAVRGSSLEEGPSQGLPIWRDRAHDPSLSSDIMRRTDFAEFMVAAIENDELIQKAPALVSRTSKSAMANRLPQDVVAGLS